MPQELVIFIDSNFFPLLHVYCWRNVSSDMSTIIGTKEGNKRNQTKLEQSVSDLVKYAIHSWHWDIWCLIKGLLLVYSIVLTIVCARYLIEERILRVGEQTNAHCNRRLRSIFAAFCWHKTNIQHWLCVPLAFFQLWRLFIEGLADVFVGTENWTIIYNRLSIGVLENYVLYL